MSLNDSMYQNQTADDNSTDVVELSNVFNSLTLRMLLVPKILLIITTVVMNLGLIITIAFMVKKKTVSNCFFLSISISDFLVGTFSMSFMTIYTSFGYWPLGAGICRFWVVFDFSCCAISIFNLLVITVHRYRALTTPFKVSEDFTKMKFLLLVSIWCGVYLFWLSAVIPITYAPDFNPEGCYFSYTFTYVLLSDLTAYAIPIIVLLVFNFLTYRALRLKMKRVTHGFAKGEGGTATQTDKTQTKTKIENSNTDQSISLNAATNTLNQATKNTPKKEQRVTSKDKKAVKCLTTISTTLVLCWIIFIVTWPILAECTTCVDPLLYEVGYWLAYANSCINPISLLIFHDSFRKEFKKLVTLKWLF